MKQQEKGRGKLDIRVLFIKKLSKINKELDLDKKENIPDTSVQKNDTDVDRKSKVNRMR